MSECAYCHKRRGHQTDHLINRNQARRQLNAALVRDDPAFKVRACRECNEAKGTRLLVPMDMPDTLAFLNALNIGLYRGWAGDAETLREVVR